MPYFKSSLGSAVAVSVNNKMSIVLGNVHVDTIVHSKQGYYIHHQTTKIFYIFEAFEEKLMYFQTFRTMDISYCFNSHTNKHSFNSLQKVSVCTNSKVETMQHWSRILYFCVCLCHVTEDKMLKFQSKSMRLKCTARKECKE